MEKKAVYDTIAELYKQSKMLPFRLHIEQFTLLKLLGDVKEKTILDLACGEGIYSRKISSMGAARVVGVDISPKMIELARKAGTSGKSEFIVKDVETLGKIGKFDIAVGMYLMNYAKTPKQLMRFCRAVAINLKSGGRFVGFNDYPYNPQEKYGTYEKYGFKKSTVPARKEGDPITYYITTPDGREFQFDNFYLSPGTYEKAFKQAGFSSFSWEGPWLSKEGSINYPEGYWDDFMNHPPLCGMSSRKN
ncbi:MAG: class I SAM-dependent methyltransferase [Desulfobacula sp.]|jgi:toxoflavin synthase|nr:class I SAM-dependent methyltransferase [Desulfobacula sp.]MBT6339156.1 class I SAM-dependent methyltransferase [Desulfobacula sp.]